MSSAIEVRDNTSDGTVTLRSYASLYQPVSYTIRGGSYSFEEDVHRDAFRRSLATNPDTVFRTEHSGPPLARTTSGTLRLGTDARGLWYEAKLDMSDPDVQALVPKVRRGDYGESSFAFKCNSDSWNSDRTRRTLMECDLHRGDVSAVTFGASSATAGHMTLRNHGSDQERRAWADAISASHWGGPGAMIYRGAWTNQHGSSCGSCGGNGECPQCHGKGWQPTSTPDSGSGGTDTGGGRSAIVMPSRLVEFESALIAAQARAGAWK